jgi:putative acetyltransferase
METSHPPLSFQFEKKISPDVAALIERLDTYLVGLYPPESNHLLDVAALEQPDIAFLVARLEGVVVGCGALRIRTAEYGELKRIFVDPSARGAGLGHRIAQQLEQHAIARQLPLLYLETGIHQPEALALFRAQGFVECEPFGDYAPDPLSVFMRKTLSRK